VQARDRTADVVVVGAGPAGTAAAITLARSGREVLVVDKASFPRDKVCGDGLTTSALRELEHLGLDPATVPSWVDIDDVVVCSPSGRAVRFPLPRDGGRFGAVARRAELDARLVELARDAGATVIERAAVTGAVQSGPSIVLEVDGLGSVEASWAIGADGMWSPLRKLLGVSDPTYRGEWHAFRQYLTGVSPQASRELIVWFDADLLPGYAWSFPVADGVANVGFGILRGTGYKVADMAAVWRELLARPHIRDFIGPDARPEGPHRAWPIPARVDRAVLTAGRALFVGDAAAATDPMTGEGIGQALTTGRWAAEAIVAHGTDGAATRSAYEHRVAHDLAVDHRLAERLSSVLSRPWGARAAVRVAGANDWTRRSFARWLYEDYPRALLLTPSRWHRGMLTGSGAYRSD
jgi:geranylgeranyl reductase family protein